MTYKHFVEILWFVLGVALLVYSALEKSDTALVMSAILITQAMILSYLPENGD